MTAYTKNTPGAPTGGNYRIGDTCTDSQSRAWTCVVAGHPGEWVSGGSTAPEFVATVPKTVVNTVTTTSLLGTGVGSMLVPANTLKAGSILRCLGSGVISTIGVPGNLFLDLSLNNLTGFISSLSIPIAANLLGNVWTVSFFVTMTNDLGDLESKSAFVSPVDSAQSDFKLTTESQTETINVAAPITFDFVATWATADPGNGITCHQFSFEIL